MQLRGKWYVLSIQLGAVLALLGCGLIRPGSEARRSLSLRASVELPAEAGSRTLHGAERSLDDPCDSENVNARAFVFSGSGNSQFLIAAGPLEATKCTEVNDGSWTVEYAGELDLFTDLAVANNCRIVVEILTRPDDILGSWQGSVHFQDLGFALDVSRLYVSEWMDPDCSEDCVSRYAEFCIQNDPDSEAPESYKCVEYNAEAQAARMLGLVPIGIDTPLFFDGSTHSLSWSYVRTDAADDIVTVEMNGVVVPSLSYRGEAAVGKIVFDSPETLAIGEAPDAKVQISPLPQAQAAIEGEFVIQFDSEGESERAEGELSLFLTLSAEEAATATRP